MRLPCDVEIQNRMLPSHGVAKRARSTRASLVIGRRPIAGNKEVGIFLAVCTARDRDGAKFSLKGNVVKIFGRFVQEGKATIRIQDPAQDLCISKADPLQLKTFLMAVNLAHRDKSLPETQLSSLVPAKQSHVERPKTNVVITRRQDYPITTGFPKTMESLQVNQCGLRRVDKRILQAKHLRRLDLSGNQISTIPEELGELQHLSELNLSNNQLQHLPVGLLKSNNLCASLQCLDLSHNSITRLPGEFVHLRRLVRLNVSFNDLESLPENVGGLQQLRFLNLSHSTLTHFPFSFTRLKLDEIDLSENKGDLLGSRGNFANVNATPEGGWRVPSLLEIAGRTVLVKKLPFKEGDIPVTLCYDLSPSRWQYCFHGNPVSVEGSHGTFCIALNLSRVAHTITLSNMDPRTALVPCKGVLCSSACQYKVMSQSTKFR